jgi:flagellar protein FlaG
LDTEFKIISDPDNIPTSGSNYVFYLKNIGGSELSTTNTTFNAFIDGEIVVVANYNFSDTSIKAEEVTTLYIAGSEISAGDHTLRVVGPQAIEDEFTFTI